MKSPPSKLNSIADSTSAKPSNPYENTLAVITGLMAMDYNSPLNNIPMPVPTVPMALKAIPAPT